MAVATFILGAITYCGNKGARKAESKQLNASLDQVKESQRQLTASYLPVIVPYQRAAESLTYRGGTISADGGPQITENPSERHDLPSYSAAHMAVENVGVGPALNLRGSFTGPNGSGAVRVPLEAVAAGAKGILSFENSEGASLSYGSSDQITVEIDYNDVAGNEYGRRFTYDPMQRAYVENHFVKRPEWLPDASIPRSDPGVDRIADS